MMDGRAGTEQGAQDTDVVRAVTKMIVVAIAAFVTEDQMPR